MKASYIYNNIYIFFILAAFCISFYKRKENIGVQAKLFPFFFLLTLIVEIIGIFMGILEKPNLWLYNNYGVVEFTFYLWVLREIITTTTIKKILLVVLIVFGITYLLNNIFGQGKGGNGFSSITYAVGCILIVFACLFYFYELFEKPNSFHLFQQPAFWICTALLFDYTCTFPFFGLANFLAGYPKYVLRNFTTFIEILNIFLYSMLSIAFVCQSVFKKSSPSLLPAVS